MTEPKYTVFIRVPIPRGDFVDPPPVEWDSTKDDALWKILSGAAQKEIDWNKVADRFEVTVDFLLQQVAYLTERHASQVRAQVRKATAAAKGSAAPSPVPPVESSTQHYRTSSAFSARGVDSPMVRTDSNNPAPGSRPGISRNTSTNTAVLQDAPASPRIGSKPLPSRPSLDNTNRKRLSSLPIETKPPASPRSLENEREELRDASPGPAESSSGESSDDESNPVESRIIRRPPRFKQQETEPQFQAEEDDTESEPAFQPYKSPEQTPDLGSTLRGDNRGAPKASSRQLGKQPMSRSQTSDSSNGPGAIPKRTTSSRDHRAGGPLSPRRRAEMAAQGSPGRGKVNSQDGSEGTPSMGSSFSDLDDASVTQSALEEALASHLQGGASSRFSISQAFRSRYTPGSNK